MLEVVFKRKSAPDFHWVSLVEPTLRELSQVAVEYDLHPTSVHDCLEPEHLPKFEQIGEVSFIIVRACDEYALANADTMQQLTSKIAFFASRNFLITIHRKDHEYLKVIRNKWRVGHKNLDHPAFMIMVDIYMAVMDTYDGPLSMAADEIEQIEHKIFTDNAPASIIEQMYLLRRKASVYKNMLHQFNDILTKKSLTYSDQAPYLQDVIDNTSRLAYNANQLSEDTNNLLNIHLSLASHRTNEVMRVLTIFSVFFMPLTFVVGVYGMNFRYMPELGWQIGYGGVWVLMIVITGFIFAWFRRKGWLRD
jgi:magnesium transporter